MDWALGRLRESVKQLSGWSWKLNIYVPCGRVTADTYEVALYVQSKTWLVSLSRNNPGRHEINAKDAVSLWCQRGHAYFHDRLINDHDRDWFVAELSKCCSDAFGLVSRRRSSGPAHVRPASDYQQMPEK